MQNYNYLQKIQTVTLKKVLLILLVLAGNFAFAQVKELNESLHIADSLFAAQKYTESFEIYQSIHETAQMASPAMLMKMAFIKEALDDIPNTLYYLNLCYLRTSDEAVLQKMEDLASKHNLAGYDYDEVDFFLNLYYLYYNEVSFGIMGLILIIFAGIVYRKLKFGVRPVALGVIFILLTGTVFYSVNFGREFRQGIVEEGNTYLMVQPSSSSRVLDIISEGHRLKIIGQNDVWYKVEWNDKPAYVKYNRIQPIYRQ